mmetsp:Transcript_19852/g.47564  ORF Transcript_19852/g.47564 Transcript_19852/m.47564 type:complete len:101 (-) Transcript_19852:222-524(-)
MKSGCNLQLYFPRLRPPDVSHCGSEFTWLEGGERTIWLGDANVIRYVRIWTRISCCLHHLGLRSFLRNVSGMSLIAASRQLVLVSLPGEFKIVRWWQAVR